MSSPATLFRKYLWRSIACAIPVLALLRAAWHRQAEVMLWPKLTQEPSLDDPNIWTRLEQTRQWLTGGDFSGNVLNNSDSMGSGIERAWTRLMDILIAAFHSVTPDTWVEEIRLMVAAAWLPAVLGIVAFALLARSALKRFNNWHVLFALVFLLAVNPLMGYFTPGDVDRHSIIIVMWCGVLGLLLRPLTPRTAALAGAMLGVMLWGDIESLAPVVVVLAITGLATLRKRHGLRPFAVMAASTAVIAAATLAIDVHDYILPLSTDGAEFKPLLTLGWPFALQHIWQPVLALALLLRLRRGRASDATLGALLAACCFLTLAQMRFSYYAQAAALLVLAPLLPVYAMQVVRGLPRTFRPYTLLLSCCAVVLALAWPFGTAAERDVGACHAQMRYVIQTQQLQKLAGDNPRTIYVPAEVGGDIIFFTPYAIISDPYQRQVEMLRAIATDEDKGRKLLKDNHVDSLFYCPAQLPKNSWLAGKPPEGFTPVEGLEFTTKQGALPVLYTLK